MLNSVEVGHKCLIYFGKTLPMSQQEWKDCFREAARRLRPDLANSKVNDTEFMAISELYKVVMAEKPSWAVTNGVSRELKTKTGELLSELGLGLGPRKNGRDCTECGHKGYREELNEGWAPCGWCFAGFAYTQPCNRCNGTGKFSKHGKVVGDCFGCKGRGVRACPSMVRCRVCNGRGGKEVPVGVDYKVCYTCKGTGEIELFNPVILKGSLSNKR